MEILAHWAEFHWLGTIALCLVGALLLAACDGSTPTPATPVPPSATRVSAPTPTPTLTPTPSPTATQKPTPTRTPLPLTPTTDAVAPPVLTTSYRTYVRDEDGVALWQHLLDFNGRSYRWPPINLPQEELARIGRVLYPDGLPTRRMQDQPGLYPAVVNVLDTARYDLDDDGQAENIYALHMPFVIPNPTPDPDRYSPTFMDGPITLAVLSADNSTVYWQSPGALNHVGDEDADYTGEESFCGVLAGFDAFVAPYRIAPGVTGLLFYHYTVLFGTSTPSTGWVTIYAWQDGQAHQVWDDTIGVASRMGAFGSESEDTPIRFVDVDADGVPELLTTTDLKHFSKSRDESGNWIPEFCFRLCLPGSLVYRWTGQAYTACALRPRDDADELWPLRCDGRTFYSSLVSSTFTLDGDLTDFDQLQYNRKDTLTPATYLLGLRAEMNALWDPDTLYLRFLGFKITDTTRVQLWFDTDLAGDFDSATPNHDDVLVDVALPREDAGVPQVTVMRPDAAGEWQPDPAATARVQAVGRLELAIPLDLLGLKEALQGVRFGAVEYKPPRYGNLDTIAVYHPRAIWAIGFAAALGEGTIDPAGTWRPESLDGNDPTTWGNLVFMAED